ncbi:MAG: Ig-like domain-containing protein, partial [Lachnospiraceae bacterium]|nr:Ig-like domain-containing protein [Lachnospiraceae bacterium]
SGDSASTVPDTPEPEIEMKEYPRTLFVGESAGLLYSLNNAESGDSSVASSDSGIVKINSDGTLTAVGAGTAEIIIKASGVTKTFQVEVKTVPVEEVEITNAPEKIQLGESCKVSAKVLPENATSKKIIWKSDNKEILEIDSNGTMTGKSAGVATITAQSENNIEAKTVIEVYEVLPEDIECEASIEMIVGDKRELQIKILPENSNKKNYTAACADSDILTCKDSNLQAVAEGETILHIETWNGVKKDVPVKVDIIPVKDIEIMDETSYLSSNTIDKATEILLSAKVSPDNATYQDVEWSSSDERVLSVEHGHFVVHGTGEVTLTCRAHGGVVE